MTHDLKIWPQYYCRVADGSKTFEVRKNDRGFQPSDIVELNYFDPEIIYDEYDYKNSNAYMNRKVLKFKVGYVLPIDAERVVFSLLPIEVKS